MAGRKAPAAKECVHNFDNVFVVVLHQATKLIVGDRVLFFVTVPAHLTNMHAVELYLAVIPPTPLDLYFPLAFATSMPCKRDSCTQRGPGWSAWIQWVEGDRRQMKSARVGKARNQQTFMFCSSVTTTFCSILVSPHRIQ
jgi:hypothetical protein